MEQHIIQHEEKEESFDFIYYLVALVCGVFTGFIIGKGFIWVPIGAILGLLTAAAFIKLAVRGREEV